nr:MAG: replication initiator protein [Microvirus sp.]
MCTSPRSVQFNPDGSLNWNKNYCNRELVPFKVPCGKCVECLLERARDWAVRCTHEAQMHAQNAFITLTYSDAHLPLDGKLNHEHFQEFMYKLRKKFGEGIGFFMCGEYGEQTGRPHYHACLFGVDFDDKVQFGENFLGDKLWTSKTLDALWGRNDSDLCPNKIGEVTPQSAGYVARYVLKKQNPSAPQGYQKMSRKHAIGKRYIEKWHRDVFVHARGSIILSDGSKSKIPRYYEKWYKQKHPQDWIRYVTEVKPENTKRLSEKAEKEHAIYLRECEARELASWSYKSPLARKRDILKHKQKKLKRNFL